MLLSYLLLSLLLSDADHNRRSHVTREACDARFPRQPSAVGVQRQTQASPGALTRRLASQWSRVGISRLLCDVHTRTGAASADLISRQ